MKKACQKTSREDEFQVETKKQNPQWYTVGFELFGI